MSGREKWWVEKNYSTTNPSPPSPPLVLLLSPPPPPPPLHTRTPSHTQSAPRGCHILTAPSIPRGFSIILIGSFHLIWRAVVTVVTHLCNFSGVSLALDLSSWCWAQKATFWNANVMIPLPEKYTNMQHNLYGYCCALLLLACTLRPSKPLWREAKLWPRHIYVCWWREFTSNSQRAELTVLW